MLYRVRTTFKDRPGVLAALARACGDAGINILSFQAFPAHDGVTDELVVSVGGGWSENGVHGLVADAGGLNVSVTRCTARSLRDAPTSYLRSAAAVLDGRASLADELARLLETDPPDVAEYAGHDTFETTEPIGLSVTRAVPFTPTERARAAALVDLVGTHLRAPAEPARPRRRPAGEDPAVREAEAEDANAIADMHTRCSADTLSGRYQAPMTGVIHPRMARRLATPAAGVALVATTGPTVVGHALGVPDEDDPSLWEVGVLVEDAWQRHGIGTRLIRRAGRCAREQGASILEIVTLPGNDALLRTVGRAGFLARISRDGGALRIGIDLAGSAPRSQDTSVPS